LTAAVAAAARLRAWLDGRDVALAGWLAEVAPFPEKALADAGRTSHRRAGRALARHKTAQAVPALGAALADGEVSGGHMDVVGRALRQLEPAQRQALAGRDQWLADLAARTTPDEFEQAVRAEVRRLQADAGVARLARQRRATRLRHWIDGDGMWCLAGRFDPETGLKLHGRLKATVERLFAETVPEHCPSDPLERQAFLRAHALVALVDGHGTGVGSPECIVVVDATAPDPATGGPTVDWGLPVELPDEVLRRWFDDATVSCVVVRHGVVLHAPGRLDLGRTTRIANRAQRRALQALYPTCAIPGCGARYELCHLHHVTWWRHGGTTDLANLLPLCNQHHHAVHDEGWQLTLTPDDRQLTIGYPDGTTHTTGPPRRGPPPRPPAPDGTRPAATDDPVTPMRT
jgi:hypothetical protein